VNMIRWDPFGELSNLRNQVNRFFDQTLKRGIFSPVESFGPRIDLYQTEDEVVGEAELPGIESKDDIEITVTPNSLTIKGELKRGRDLREENFFHSERYYGSFCRTLPLPAEVKPEEAKASYQNGILEIRMPKSEKERKNSYRIPIQ